MTNIQDLDDVMKIFPEEEKDEYLRRAKNRPKIQNSSAVIERLVV